MKINVFQVILWTFGGYFLVRLVGLLLLQITPSFQHDFVPQAATLCAVYLALCALFAGRRPGRSWSETFATRRTNPWLIIFAFFLGIVVCVPADAFADFIERLAPMDKALKEQLERALKPRSMAHGVALFMFIAGIAPFAEELFFRGALYTGLRPSHTPLSAGWTTAVFFTLSHDEPRFWPSILILAGLLATVRAVSGSLWPSVFMHVAFNATSLAVFLAPPPFKDPSLVVVFGCIPIALALLGLMVWIGRHSESADRARRVDLEPDPGIGETDP
jgi:membrane protease YdiL (CAAX protease family)